MFDKCIGYVLKPYFAFLDNQFEFVSNGGYGRALFAFQTRCGLFYGS